MNVVPAEYHARNGNPTFHIASRSDGSLWVNPMCGSRGWHLDKDERVNALIPEATVSEGRVTLMVSRLVTGYVRPVRSS